MLLGFVQSPKRINVTENIVEKGNIQLISLLLVNDMAGVTFVNAQETEAPWSFLKCLMKKPFCLSKTIIVLSIFFHFIYGQQAPGCHHM